MRQILAKGIGLDKSCNKVSLECGLEAQLGCYCGYPFTFQPNYGKWSIDYDGRSVYKVSEFGDRCLYVARKEEFESLGGYVFSFLLDGIVESNSNSLFLKIHHFCIAIVPLYVPTSNI